MRRLLLIDLRYSFLRERSFFTEGVDTEEKQFLVQKSSYLGEQVTKKDLRYNFQVQKFFTQLLPINSISMSKM